MSARVAMWLNCQFVRKLSSGKELRHPMFVSVGGELYAFINDGTSRRLWPDHEGGYIALLYSSSLKGKIRVRAGRKPWGGQRADGYHAFIRGFSSFPPPWVKGVMREYWRKGWHEGQDMHKGRMP